MGGWRRHVLAEGVTGLDHAIFIKRLLTRPGECNVKQAMFILVRISDPYNLCFSFTLFSNKPPCSVLHPVALFFQS